MAAVLEFFSDEADEVSSTQVFFVNFVLYLLKLYYKTDALFCQAEAQGYLKFISVTANYETTNKTFNTGHLLF